MRKLFVVVPALAMVLAAFPSSGASEATPTAIEIRLENPEMDHNGGYDEFECGGTAPLQFVCETGLHTRGGLGYIVLGFRSMHMPGYTGTLEALLTHATGEIRFQCRWTSGSLEGCSAMVPVFWPPMGSAFDFRCHSLMQSARLPRVPGVIMPGGIPGGHGDWSCYIGHT